MPARKTARKQVKRYQRNHSQRRATRTAVNGAKRAMAGEDVEAAERAVRAASSTLDKAVQKGILHKNNASRSKSRLAARLNAMAGSG